MANQRFRRIDVRKSLMIDLKCLLPVLELDRITDRARQMSVDVIDVGRINRCVVEGALDAFLHLLVVGSRHPCHHSADHHNSH